MATAILCPCGKRLRVRDEMKGKRLRCPSCQRTLEVPGDELSAATVAEPRVERKATEHKPKAATRVWLIGNAETENILVFTHEAVYIAKLAKEYRKPVTEAIEEKGAVPEQLLGESCQCVFVNNLTEVQFDRNASRLGCYLTLRFHHEGRVEIKTVACGSQVRDEFFAALKERLGRGWRQQEEQTSRWQVAGCSLIALGILLAITLLFLALHQLVMDPESKTKLRDVVACLGILSGFVTVLCFGISVNSLIYPPLLVFLRPKVERVPSPPPPPPAPSGQGLGWSRFTWCVIIAVVIVALDWTLPWFGIVIPRWLHWSITGLMAVGFLWAWLTDPTTTVQEEEEKNDEDAGEAAPEPEVPTRRIVVLPEGSEPAELELCCVGCQKSGLMLMPANVISRQRNFVCSHCGKFMRQPWRKALFLGPAALGGLGILLGALVRFGLLLGPNAFSEVHVNGAWGIISIGVVIVIWAVNQLRLSPPLGSVPRPRTIWPLLLGASLLGFLLLLVVGAYFALMFLIDHAF